MHEKYILQLQELESEINDLRNEEDSEELNNLHRAISEYLVSINR